MRDEMEWDMSLWTIDPWKSGHDIGTSILTHVFELCFLFAKQLKTFAHFFCVRVCVCLFLMFSASSSHRLTVPVVQWPPCPMPCQVRAQNVDIEDSQSPGRLRSGARSIKIDNWKRHICGKRPGWNHLQIPGFLQPQQQVARSKTCSHIHIYIYIYHLFTYIYQFCR